MYSALCEQLEHCRQRSNPCTFDRPPERRRMSSSIRARLREKMCHLFVVCSRTFVVIVGCCTSIMKTSYSYCTSKSIRTVRFRYDTLLHRRVREACRPITPEPAAVCGNCLEIATKKMAGPRDSSTILSYGTLILSFAYDHEIKDNPCTFHVLCTCDQLRPPCATCDLRNCDRAVGTYRYSYTGDTRTTGGG